MLATKRILSRPVISKICTNNITFIITLVTHHRRWKSLYVKYYISYSVSIIYKYTDQPRWKSLEPPNRILWDVQALVLRRRDLALQTLFRWSLSLSPSSSKVSSLASSSQGSHKNGYLMVRPQANLKFWPTKKGSKQCFWTKNTCFFHTPKKITKSWL